MTARVALAGPAGPLASFAAALEVFTDYSYWITA